MRTIAIQFICFRLASHRLFWRTFMYINHCYTTLAHTNTPHIMQLLNSKASEIFDVALRKASTE